MRTNVKRSEKEKVVADLSERLEGVSAVFVTDFSGLDVEKMTKLRRGVRDAGGSYQVVKNTLLRRITNGTELEKLTEMFTGNNALGFCQDDPVPLAKALVDFAKDNEKLVIKGGMLGAQVMAFEQIKALADLPSREVLLAQLLGTLNNVPGSFVRVLNAIPSKLVYALSAIRDQKEQEEQAA